MVIFRIIIIITIAFIYTLPLPHTVAMIMLPCYPPMQHLTNTPHYHILVDSNYDASGTPYHYIPAEDLEAAVGTNVQVSAPEVDNFFEGFKDGKHIPRPWLRDRYPVD